MCLSVNYMSFFLAQSLQSHCAPQMVFISFNFENESSEVAMVTGRVKNPRSAVQTLQNVDVMAKGLNLKFFFFCFSLHFIAPLLCFYELSLMIKSVRSLGSHSADK